MFSILKMQVKQCSGHNNSKQMNPEDEIVIYKLKKITIVSIIFMMVELMGGYYANSIAILADAFHLLSDVLAYVISLFAVLMSSRAATKHLTFGYEKLQPLGALLNVVIIWVVTVELSLEATERIISKSVVTEPLYMFLTSLFGLACNLYIMQVLHSDQHASHHNCAHHHHDHAPIEGPESPIDLADSINTHIHSQSCNHQSQFIKPIPKQHKHGSNCSHGHASGQGHAHKHQDKQQQQQQHQDRTEHKHEEKKVDFHEHKHGDSCNHSNSGEHIQSDQKLSLSHEQPGHHFQNINMEAAYIHILTDIILSIGVIISASIIYFGAPQPDWSYWQLADPFCTYLFSIMAIYSTIPITRESVRLLLDGCDNPELMDAVQQDINELVGAKDISSFKMWSTNRGKHYAALKVEAKTGVDFKELKRIFESRGIKSYIEMNRLVEA